MCTRDDEEESSLRMRGSVFGLEFVLREREAVQEFAGTDGTGLNDVQLRVLDTVLNAVDPEGRRGE